MKLFIFNYGRFAFHFSYLIMLLFSVSCQATIIEESNVPIHSQHLESSPTITKADAQPNDHLILNVDGDEKIPEKIKESFLSSTCEYGCWDGIMIGSPLTTITNTLYEHVPDSSSLISLDMVRIENSYVFSWKYTGENLRVALVKQDDLESGVTFISTGLLNHSEVSFSAFINEIGFPQFVKPVIVDANTLEFETWYPNYGLGLSFQPQKDASNIPILEPHSKLQRITFIHPDNSYIYECDLTIVPWQGFGGEGVYFKEYNDTPNMTELFSRTVPTYCSDEWTIYD